MIGQGGWVVGVNSPWDWGVGTRKEFVPGRRLCVKQDSTGRPGGGLETQV